MDVVRAVAALDVPVRLRLGDAAGSVITFLPQRPTEPTKFGKALSPVWESTFRPALLDAKFWTDPCRGGVMRIVSSDKVWRWCEVVEASESGLQSLRCTRESFLAFGLVRADWEAAASRFAGGGATRAAAS